MVWECHATELSSQGLGTVSFKGFLSAFANRGTRHTFKNPVLQCAWVPGVAQRACKTSCVKVGLLGLPVLVPDGSQQYCL